MTTMSKMVTSHEVIIFHDCLFTWLFFWCKSRIRHKTVFPGCVKRRVLVSAWGSGSGGLFAWRCVLVHNHPQPSRLGSLSRRWGKPREVTVFRQLQRVTNLMLRGKCGALSTLHVKRRHIFLGAIHFVFSDVFL